MGLLIELPDDADRQLRQEAARRGQSAEDLARALVEAALSAAQRERAAAVAALFQRWNADDAANPDSDPVTEISRVRFREANLE
jgi:plasmid stability protein